ncbi:MAG: hypothetical protein AB8F34_06735 [Akkermansiaceae bacterium]
MTKKTLTLALVAASIAVTCAQVTAEIRVEAVGLPAIQLSACPQVKTLPCTSYHQYKVIGHFSNLTLGDANQSGTNSSTAPRLWNRLLLTSSGNVRPLDIFKSSTNANTGTGHQVMSCKAVELAKQNATPTLRIDGTTANPSGKVILCVDFIPAAPKPKGKLNLTGMTVRDGQKIAIGWQRQR